MQSRWRLPLGVFLVGQLMFSESGRSGATGVGEDPMSNTALKPMLNTPVCFRIGFRLADVTGCIDQVGRRADYEQ